MDVSVVIVNWNTRDLLRQCLNSILAQTKGIAFEVIVIDNGSTDGSVAIVQHDFPGVVLIANDANKGFAAAINQGIEVAKSRYVLLLNSDTVILDNAVAEIVAFADSHPHAAVVGCRVLNPDGTLQPTCFIFPSVLNMLLSTSYVYKIFPRNKFFGRERMTWWNRNDVRQVDVVTGCFMLVRRSAIDQVGAMDERFFMYGEETDWCYRFKKAGWKILFTPQAEIIHLGRASSRLIERQARLQLSGSILLFFRKHKGYLQYILACLFTALFFSIRVPYWFCKSLLFSSSKKANIAIVHTYLIGAIKAMRGANGLCMRK